MAVINKANVPAPSVPKRVVENVEGIGGDVVIRGLYLSERSKLFSLLASEGKAEISLLLHMAVVDDKGDAIYTLEEWEQYGASNYKQALALFEVAKELSGFDVEANKAKS